MSTVSRSIADNIIINNGYYLDTRTGELSDDPRVIAVLVYNNIFTGDLSHALAYNEDSINRYLTAEACINCKVYWRAL